MKVQNEIEMKGKFKSIGNDEKCLTGKKEKEDEEEDRDPNKNRWPTLFDVRNT